MRSFRLLSFLLVFPCAPAAPSGVFLHVKAPTNQTDPNGRPESPNLSSEGLPRVLWVGCSADDLAEYGGPANTTSICAEMCSPLRHFAIKNRSECWCGADSPEMLSMEEADLGDCGEVCPGEEGLEPTRYCGKDGKLAVYETPAPPPPDLPLPPLAAPERQASEVGQYIVTERVVVEEGGAVGSSHWLPTCPTYPSSCEAICDDRAGCTSFSYSSAPRNCVCFFKDRCVGGEDPIVSPAARNSHYRTFYRPCSEYLMTERVVQREGDDVREPLSSVGSPEECKRRCDQRADCRSFSYSASWSSCFFKDKCVSSSDPIVGPNAPNAGFVTFYKTTCNSDEEEPSEATTTAPTPAPTPAPPLPDQLSPVVQKYGRLAVRGTQIVSSRTGEVVRLRGMSFFWSQWGGHWYNRDVVRWLVTDWKVTVLRAAMGIRQDGYLGHPEREKQKVITVVDACIEAGIYVIIDWHVDGTNTPYPDEARAFFEEMTARYGSSPNVMWEPWNEPTGDSNWLAEIKPYHEMMVPLIRRRSPENIIILGSRSWCQEVGEASRDPVAGSNLVYALHFYATHHGEDYRDKAREALSNGVAIFATEWGVPSYTCQGDIDWAAVQEWATFMEVYDISDAGWSINDKAEVCSALVPGANTQGGWAPYELQDSGEYFRDMIRADYNL